MLERDDVSVVHASYYRDPRSRARDIERNQRDIELHWTQLDATDDGAVAEWFESVGQLDWLINCVGMLHDDTHGPEKAITQFEVQHFNNSMAVNCLPTLLLAKHALPALKGADEGVFATISARVGSITDNRLGGWYSYRSSKAALNMVLKTLAIEWARSSKRLRVAALHPGTTDTALSEPFQDNVPEGKLFAPTKTASLLLEQIDRLHERESGCFLAYDGEVIPW